MPLDEGLGAKLGQAPARALPAWRHRVDAWLPLVLALAATVAALGSALVLWLAPIGADAARAAARLATRSAELALALQLPAGPLRDTAVADARGQIETLLGQLPGTLTVPAGLDTTKLHERWAQLRGLAGAQTEGANLALHALLRQQMDHADALATALDAARQRRQRGRDAALGLAIATTAGLLVWGMLKLRQHRRQWRRAMKQFSSELGNGAWQAAVRGLRNERSGPPSAWDALATGVESVLGESDRRWQTLADMAADWYWETDAQHRLRWISGATPAISAQGWSIQRVMGRRYDQIEFFEAPDGGWHSFNAGLKAARPFSEFEFRIQAAQGGAAVWVSISGRPLRNQAGRFAGFEGVGRDVTARREAETRLRQSEQRWSTMAGLASDFYWETDAQHRLLPMRPELRRRAGISRDRFEGMTPWEAHPRALTPEQWADHRAELEARRPFRSLELEVELEPQRFAWMSLSGVPRFDAGGRFVGYHGVGRDVTMRIQAERVLMRHNEELRRKVDERTAELRAMNQELDAFARQISHELRTPIGQVQGLAHLLEARAAARLLDEDRRLLAAQVQAAGRMRETVEALLQLARSAMQPMPREDVDLSALAHGVLAELPAIPRQAPLRAEIQPGMSAPTARAPMRIVLMNLLSNAAKFTRHTPDPWVRVWLAGAQNGSSDLVVQDNGAGFEMARAGRLFKPFNRLHRGEDYPGVGIGLTTVQRIVERLGGSVSAEGRPGQGARFTIRLPAAGADGAPGAASGPASR